jgi:hypothetical protein
MIAVCRGVIDRGMGLSYDISFRDRVRRSLTELLYLMICDTMFDLVVVVGIRKHERNVTAKSEVLFVSDLGIVWKVG